jgi:hypothetical protein
MTTWVELRGRLKVESVILIGEIGLIGSQGQIMQCLGSFV